MSVGNCKGKLGGAGGTAVGNLDFGSCLDSQSDVDARQLLFLWRCWVARLQSVFQGVCAALLLLQSCGCGNGSAITVLVR